MIVIQCGHVVSVLAGRDSRYLALVPGRRIVVVRGCMGTRRFGSDAASVSVSLLSNLMRSAAAESRVYPRSCILS